METENEELIYKVVSYILLAIFLIWLIVHIGLLVVPLDNNSEIIKNEGFWYYVRVFAPMVGAAIGAFASFRAAIYTFTKNKEKDEKKEKNEKAILKKKILFSLGTIIGSLYGQAISLYDTKESIEDQINKKNIKVINNDIYSIPYNLILSMPENDLFKILIEDNSISNFKTIKNYNLFYKSILNCQELTETIKKYREMNYEFYNNFSENCIKKVGLQIRDLILLGQIGPLNNYWDIIEIINYKKFITSIQIQEITCILQKEVEAANKMKSYKVSSVLSELLDIIYHENENYFYVLGQLKENIEYNFKIISRMLRDGNSLIQDCYSEEEYNQYSEFLVSEFKVNINILKLF